jgi:putative FmdB family regulatory protein
MPIYEYNCQGCRKDVEILIRGKEKPLCPLCGSSELNKHLSVVAAPGSKSSSDFPSAMPAGGCGRPQCGMYGCQGLE